jgi:hypothetical protein
MFSLTSIASTQPLRMMEAVASSKEPRNGVTTPQMGSYRCYYRGQKATHDLSAPADNQIVYVTPIFHAAARFQVIQAFNTYMSTAYDLSKIQGPTAGCDSDVQASTADSQEKQWAANKIEVIHVNWTDSPADSTAAAAAAAAPPTAAATAQPSSAQSATFFISCSTLPDAGVDTYYTSVFDIGAKPGTGKMTPYAVGAYVGGKWMVPAVSSQSVLDHFQAYLTQKGYKFKPGSSSACDVKPTEVAAKAAQHKRAHEGGGCSTCGKVVETAWKDKP